MRITVLRDLPGRATGDLPPKYCVGTPQYVVPPGVVDQGVLTRQCGDHNMGLQAVTINAEPAPRLSAFTPGLAVRIDYLEQAVAPGFKELRIASMQPGGGDILGRGIDAALQQVAVIAGEDQKFASHSAAVQERMLKVEVLPKKLDEEVAAAMVAGFGGVLTRLTPSQAEYIGVAVDGPYKPESYKY